MRVRLRLVPVALGVWAVAAVVVLAPAAAPKVAAALWLGALLATTALLRRRSSRRSHAVVVLVLTLCAGAAVASHVAFAAPAREAATTMSLTGGRALEIDVDVTGKVERRADGMLVFDGVTRRVSVGDETRVLRIDVVVRVAPEDVSGRLDVGASVVVRGTARVADAGERAVFDVTASRGLDVLAAPTGAAGVAGALRERLVASAAGLPGAGAQLLPGLAVGDTRAVTAELDAAMKASSLSHLTAVSGANCALVVGIGFALAAMLGAPRRLRVVVGLAVLTGFVVLVTPEPSVVRAATMAAIAMLGVLLGRSGAGMAVLCLAVAACLVADPWLSLSLGFALSVVATAALLLLARPLAEGLARGIPRPLALGISVPLAAQLACGPLLVLISPTVPLYGVVANMLAAPAAPVATVVGLMACLAAPLPWLQDGLVALAWLPASWIGGTAQTMSALPGGTIPWVDGLAGAVGLSLAGALVAVLIIVGPSRRGHARAVRSIAGAAVAMLVGVIAGTTALGGIAGPLTVPRDGAIIACDVGQGDAVVLRSSAAVALVDVGPEPDPVRSCLARVGAARIDLLVLTHFDLDHVGGIDAVLGRVSTVLHGPPTSTADRALLAALEAGGASMVAADSGMTGSLGDATWRVLWPDAQGKAFTGGNDASVVLEVRGGGIPATLLLGDLSESPQRALVATGSLRPPYAVVKVAHHGSADQFAGLYAAAAPAVALVTVGEHNDYGHPREETLALITAVAERVARTDVDGMVVIRSADGALEIWRERGGVAAGR